MTNSIQTSTAVAATHANSAPYVREILDIEFPHRHFADSIAVAVRALRGPDALKDAQPLQAVEARKAILEAMPLAELKQLLSDLKSAQTKRTEAARFYNAPKAKADLAEWLSLDFWTLDEAVALLIGRDPRVVNKQTIEREAAKSDSSFIKLFRGLQLRAERSEVMTASPKLRPAQVALWGKSVLGSALPAAFLPLLAEPLATVKVVPQLDESMRSEAPASDLKKTVVNRAALKAMSSIWPTVEGDLHHAQRNGLAEASKAEGRDQWWREAAVEWAIRHGKIQPKHEQSALQGLPAGFFGIN